MFFDAIFNAIYLGIEKITLTRTARVTREYWRDRKEKLRKTANE